MFSAWIHAFRLRTLPLAMSSTILGSFIAAAERRFSLKVFLLASATTVLLQILSNLANDYGDFKNGKDNKDRIGPPRMVQSGQITPRQMIVAIGLVIILTLVTGLTLIFNGTSGEENNIKFFFLILGIAAIFAAVKYTVGKNPYGYRGFGDIFVFIFFGLVGVIGTYYLHTHLLKPDLILPAASIGFLSAGVLNLNNMRDYYSDKKAMKRTLVVIMGSENAKIYHLFLIIGAMATVLVYTLINFTSPFQFLFLIPVPFFIQNVVIVFKNKKPVELNTELRKLALSTLLFSVAFGVGLMF
ncbi:MAG: 1,4-dihydroxy-2-naphthoate polyprenyltransferase [Bacteroidales bacterium]|nr:1,4-dihydroxy-2-naphthoate polyprenyltransferase [Bacteroidales bacterium]